MRVYSQGRGRYIDTYAALDSAAGDCLCSRELMDLLEICGDARETAVTTATGTTEISTAYYFSLEIRGYRTDEVFFLRHHCSGSVHRSQ